MDKRKKVMLCGADAVKANTYINYNVDDSVIGTSIREAQDVHLQSVLGSNLLFRLQELVYNKATGQEDAIDAEGNGAYRELLDDYVLPYLTAKAQALACVPLSYKIRNLGTVKTGDTNITSPSIREIMAVMKRCNVLAARYATHLSKYLCAHRDEFPELNQNDCGCGAYVPPILGKTFVYTGLVLGDTKNGCGCC